MDDLTVTSVSDDDTVTSLSDSDLCEPGTHVRKWFRQGSWFDYAPKRIHELALIRIGQHLFS